MTPLLPLKPHKPSAQELALIHRLTRAARITSGTAHVLWIAALAILVAHGIPAESGENWHAANEWFDALRPMVPTVYVALIDGIVPMNAQFQVVQYLGIAGLVMAVVGAHLAIRADEVKDPPWRRGVCSAN